MLPAQRGHEWSRIAEKNTGQRSYLLTHAPFTQYRYLLGNVRLPEHGTCRQIHCPSSAIVGARSASAYRGYRYSCRNVQVAFNRSKIVTPESFAAETTLETP
ncbi:uncharacterized protein L3040_002279 [Drepanopeziza brunnea f. sp. 'multigermtubi']|uniref:uncharacterized protein n=1 Tax=Drepanopeziza brunnea f. sp. 'multigermtubi' TaxID=698441 RepID=UPI00239A4158|nr:hypothetical protein L3040_002279 [Drepanopeziza brunnea f. sp. 'multigermtubi']